MNISLLIIGIALSGVLAYLITKLNKKAGAWITILSSITSLVVIFMLKDYIDTEYSFGVLEFKLTTFGWYFSILMTIIFSSVSLFNPYWMDKIIHPAAYNMLYLLSLGSTLGVFASKNFLGLFICLEVMVWSSMFIIPFGKSRKASVVYYAFSAFGSLTMLFGILFLYSKYNSFEIKYVLNQVSNDPLYATVTFVLFSVAGLVKLGVFPFHIWLPVAHGNAPDTFSPILSGGLVKVGGFVAFMAVVVMPSYKAFSSVVHVMGVPIYNYLLMVLGAISIIIGTLMAIKQEDFKKLIAYSSVANGGYILIAIALVDSLSLTGGLLHMFAHAIASAAAFLSIAAVSYRTGTTKMSELGGLIHRMPVTYLVYLIAIISMAGIPPMVGFISKWFIYQSLISNGMVFIAFATFFGSIGSFLYVFRPLSAVFLGQLSEKHENVKEAPVLMLIPMIILSLLTLFYGVLPGSLLKVINNILSSVDIAEVSTIGTQIQGSNGILDPTIISMVFGFGFVIALLIFLVLPKSRKVGLMDTYTASEFIYTPELLHYSHNFYAPFERLYEKHPSIVKIYDALVLRVYELGKLVSCSFFRYKPSTTIFWISAVTIVLLWGGRV